jgi:hypothetical protein
VLGDDANETGIFPTASTIKFAVLDEMFRQYDAGIFDIHAVRTVPKEAIVAGSGVLPWRHRSRPASAANQAAILETANCGVKWHVARAPGTRAQMPGGA